MIRVGGFTPFSSVDYPGRLAAVVFVQGCPWRCRYCHNPHLQPRAAQAHAPPWEGVLEFLERRRGLLDAVVFSGGEPTADPGLRGAILDVRRRGFRTALHTAGIYPRRLEQVLPLVDWVGFDLKAPGGGDEYARVTGRASSARPALSSLDRVIASGVAHEVRLTWHPDLVTRERLLDLVSWLRARGAAHFALQEFRADGCADGRLVPHAADSALVQRMERRWPGFTLRRSG